MKGSNLLERDLLDVINLLVDRSYVPDVCTREGVRRTSQREDREGSRIGAIVFQARHALTETGTVGPQTLAALNVPVAKRVRQLTASLERLGETSRAVVWLHDVEGYTHEEIAEFMGKTVSFSKSQLARAHARLRRMLEREGAAR